MILANEDMESPSNAQLDLIEQLLETSVFDVEQRDRFKRGLKWLALGEVQEVVTYLLDNQLNPITHRGNHSAGEANRHLRKLK